MIENLKIKFIVIVMFAIIVISSVVFTIIVRENYSVIDRQTDEIINMLANNSGEIPDFKPDKKDDYNLINKETRFQARFLTVKTNSSGDIIHFNTKSIARVEEKDIPDIIEQIKDDEGIYENFKYKVLEKNDGKVFILLDCAAQLGSLRYTVHKSLTSILLIWLVLFIILVATSERMLKPITESVEKQKQFITNASHELKTPLAVINADIDVLEMTLPEKNEWLDSIKKQVNRLDILVKSLLNLANVQEGKKDLNIEDFSITDIINEEIEDFKSLLQGKNIEFDDSQNYFVKGEKELIKQVIIILLDNANKYATENGKIKINIDGKGKDVKVEISNNFENPDNIDFSRLFDRFYRQDQSRNSKKKGYGIGLSIAKSIVEVNKGRIMAFVNEEKMVCFRIILPKGKNN